MTCRITEQFRAFLEGLGAVLAFDLLHVLDSYELDLLIGGMSETDMDDGTHCTEYRGYEKTDSIIERRFRACLRSWAVER